MMTMTDDLEACQSIVDRTLPEGHLRPDMGGPHKMRRKIALALVAFVREQRREAWDEGRAIVRANEMACDHDLEGEIERLKLELHKGDAALKAYREEAERDIEALCAALGRLLDAAIRMSALVKKP